MKEKNEKICIQQIWEMLREYVKTMKKMDYALAEDYIEKTIVPFIEFLLEPLFQEECPWIHDNWGLASLVHLLYLKGYQFK